MLYFSCFLLLTQVALGQKTQEISDEELKTWWQKDLEQDTIPGIGLDRAYAELLNGKLGKEVIVAVLDTKIDINHEDIKDQIWVNTDEIPGNGIDDDANGYIDDVNGWNFLGNSDGEDVITQKEEPARIISEYADYFGKDFSDTLSLKKKKAFREYIVAKTIVEKEIIELNDLIKQTDSLNKIYYKAKDTIKHYTNNKNYSFETVDSLRTKYPEMESYFNLLSLALRYNVTEQDLIDQQNYFVVQRKAFDIDFNGRKILNDDPSELTDVDYGNNILRNNLLVFQHATPVAGLIGASRNNNLGINGILSQVKIMPVVMVAEGDEHDKEVALGIKYAVDNGAQIINMSWGKYQSLHKDWVQDAFRYAAENNVLLVSSAGNAKKNIDIETKYPSDEEEGVEFVDNYILVGGLTKNLDSTLVSSFSNYGKKTVDIFAPASSIFTLAVDNQYETNDGTSFASPIVAGSAALLKSYFPKLSAVQLKEILLQSGTKLDILVNRPGDISGASLVSFSSLSKTGSILNVYNAIELAARTEEE